MSTIVTLCSPLIEFPVASTAVHVTTVVPSENIAGALLDTEGFASQLSVAVACPMVTT